MKRSLALLLALVLTVLTGCTVGDLAKYPYVSQEKRHPHTSLLMAVPQEEWILALGGQLTELVSSYSDGAVKLQLMPSETPAALYETGEAELLLCTGEELCRLEPALEWLRLPFLFPSPEEFLAAVNAPDGPLRETGITVGETEGLLLGGFYDSGWMMALQPAGWNLMSGVRFGVDNRFPNREIFLTLGARDTAYGNPKKLWQLLEQGETETIEFRPDDPEPEAPAGTGLLLSRHRMDGRFLLIRREAAEKTAQDCLLQAICETATQAAAQRMDSEEAAAARLGTDRTGDFGGLLAGLGDTMRRNYQFSPASYGIPEEAAAFLAPYC